MTVIGTGFAALGVAAALLASALIVWREQPGWHLAAGVSIAAATGIGVALLAVGFSHRVWVANLEEPWNRSYDTLRDKTDAYLTTVDNNYLVFRGSHGDYRARWRDYVKDLPIPRVDERPLEEWTPFLANHPDPAVQQFFVFARAEASSPSSNIYRRLAVRTYHQYGRLLKAPGFAAWMQDESVQGGAEEIVVLLAYLEMARAGQVKTGNPPSHLGFWSLAEAWHRTPPPIALPET